MPDSPRLRQLRSDVAAGDAAAVEEFWRELSDTGTPLVEPYEDGHALVTFLWRGAAQRVNTRPLRDAEMTRLDGTDLWYRTESMPRDLRMTYWFGLDGATGLPPARQSVGLRRDLLNPRTLRFPRDRDDPYYDEYLVSLLELPDAPADEWSGRRPGVPVGHVLKAVRPTPALGGRRRLWVYRPAGVATAGLPVMVVFDGFEALGVLRLTTTLDNLIAAGRIPPLVALLFPSPQQWRRERELTPRHAIVDFVTRELLPWARHRFGVTADPTRTVVAGQSFGGLAAAWLAYARPDVVGRFIAQSGSFWWPRSTAGEPESLRRRYAAAARVPDRCYLDVGSLETHRIAPDMPAHIEAVRNLRDVLGERGCQVTYAEYSGGHDYINWRRTLADALVAVLGD